MVFIHSFLDAKSPWVSRNFCTRWGHRKWHHKSDKMVAYSIKNYPSCTKLLWCHFLGPHPVHGISANPGWNLNYYTQKENQNGSPTTVRKRNNLTTSVTLLDELPSKTTRVFSNKRQWCYATWWLLRTWWLSDLNWSDRVKVRMSTRKQRCESLKKAQPCRNIVKYVTFSSSNYASSLCYKKKNKYKTLPLCKKIGNCPNSQDHDNCEGKKTPPTPT